MPVQFRLYLVELMLEVIGQFTPGLWPETVIWTTLSLCSRWSITAFQANSWRVIYISPYGCALDHLSKQCRLVPEVFIFHQLELMLEWIQEHFPSLYPNRCILTTLSLWSGGSVKTIQAYSRTGAFWPAWACDQGDPSKQFRLIPEQVHFDLFEVMLEVIYKVAEGLRPESFICIKLRLCSRWLIKALQAYDRRVSFNHVELMLELICESFPDLYLKRFIESYWDYA